MKNTQQYDYLIVGAGFYGCVWAREAAARGKRVLLIEKRDHIGGNMYTYQEKGINVHQYGPHIFHTDDREVWDYLNEIEALRPFTNQVIANYQGELYNLPFNMNTFYQMWGVKTPIEAQAKIQQQRANSSQEPKNLEEQAISLIGTDIYQKLIKGYTEKQWGRSATALPAAIIKRLPVRFTYDNNYFNHRYQGIPENGYTSIFEKMLDHEGITLQLETDFFADQEEYLAEFPRIIYTGMIDRFFQCKYGQLAYRSLRFEHEEHRSENVQGNSVINHTAREVPYTRCIEWRHFDQQGAAGVSLITKEYPEDWTPDREAYYPVNDEENTALAAEYAEAAKAYPQVIFGGRLAEYRYYDMDQVIRSALSAVEREFEGMNGGS